MRRKKEEEIQQPEKVLEVDAAMQGSMVFKDPVNLKINGSFVGELVTKGKLAVGANANIKANIDGENVSIAGRVEGDITASAEINLLAPAKIFGDIKAPSISIERGVIFQGKCQMLNVGRDDQQDSDVESEESMTLRELAKYLEVDETLVDDWAASGRLPGSKSNDRWIFDRVKVDEWIASEKVK